MDVDIENFIQTSQEIIKIGKNIHSRIWATSTSGNYSSRLNADHIAITASGTRKGELSQEDILIVDMQGETLGTKKPSSDTIDHLENYRADKNIGAVLHFHSVNATLVSEIEEHSIVFENYEVLKALEGISFYDERISLPIFENSRNHQELMNQVNQYRSQQGIPYAYLVRRHGVYVFGRNLAKAFHHAEALEFLFMCHLKKRQCSHQE
ncbi:MAG: methylthioribulose 1-phosphate dehydratase [Deltaproteobacteria bacterium]|nr:methylthioribulose 1-phosphate dehydratase [Deltaproteobacteria bacterium]